MLRRVVGRDWVLGPGISLLRDHHRVVESMARRDRQLHVWVVNHESDLELCLRLGVRAVITDRPSHILDLLERRERPAG